MNKYIVVLVDDADNEITREHFSRLDQAEAFFMELLTERQGSQEGITKRSENYWSYANRDFMLTLDIAED